MAAFLKVTLIFALIIVLLRHRANFGGTMVVAAALLGVLFQVPLLEIARMAVRATGAPDTVNLAAMLILITFLEVLMRQTGILRRMIVAFQGLVGDQRVVMGLLPAVVGFLPSAGGAVFSAPLVEEASRGQRITPERKSFINYWYRHIWEYIFPLYPGIILAAQLARVPIQSLILLQLPLAVAVVLIGIPFAFSGMPNEYTRGSATGFARRLELAGQLVIGLGPIATVIALVLVFHMETWLAVAAVVLGVMLMSGYKPAGYVALAKEALSANTLAMVIGVMIFKEVLTGSGAVEELPAFFAALGVPSVVVIFVLPFLAAMLTGVTPAFVGISFPILLGLAGGQGLDPKTASLAFVGGFSGAMLSPAHLCLVLTVKHFKADFSQVLRMVLAPQALIAAIGFAVYFFL